VIQGCNEYCQVGRSTCGAYVAKLSLNFIVDVYWSVWLLISHTPKMTCCHQVTTKVQFIWFGPKRLRHISRHSTAKCISVRIFMMSWRFLLPHIPKFTLQLCVASQPKICGDLCVTTLPNHLFLNDSYDWSVGSITYPTSWPNNLLYLNKSLLIGHVTKGRGDSVLSARGVEVKRLVQYKRDTDNVLT